MIPAHQILSRIIWDTEFGAGRFEVGYADRFTKEIVRVPVSEVRLTPGNRFSCTVAGADGAAVMLPLHRIRAIYKDGAVIWSRK